MLKTFDGETSGEVLLEEIVRIHDISRGLLLPVFNLLFLLLQSSIV